MDTNVLYNMYTLLIFMRDDIENPDNLKICNLLLKGYEDNGALLQGIDTVTTLKSWRKAFRPEAGSQVAVNPGVWGIFTCALKRLKQAFTAGDITLAYDLVDAIHFLPESMSCGKSLKLRRYFSIYIKPLVKKYGKGELSEIEKKIGLRYFLL